MSYLVVGLPNSHSPFLPDKDYLCKYMDYRIVKLTTFQFEKLHGQLALLAICIGKAILRISLKRVLEANIIFEAT